MGCQQEFWGVPLWKSIESKLKSIEIYQLHTIQTRELENFHIKEDHKIV